MDLSVDFMGLPLKNPILIAAGPLTGSGEMMQKAIKAGAGGVVTKTIANEIRPNVRPRIVKGDKGIHNIELYSDFTLEQWEEEISYAKDHGAVVIANILGHTPSEIAYIAQRVESFGADAIELGISCPHGEGMYGVVSEPAKLYQLTKAVVDRSKVPVMVKLSPNTSNIVPLAKASEKAGACAISGIDTVRSIAGVDIKRGEAFLPTYGGYSGPAIRPIGLATIGAISQAVNIPVCGIGGIENGNNVLEYMMLGATTVQINTSIMLKGHSHIGVILEELKNLMIENNFENFNEIRGRALASLKSFEEIKVEPYVVKVNKNCKEGSCDKCIRACIYHAISRHHNTMIIDEERCTGCGLCVGMCSEDMFELVWKD